MKTIADIAKLAGVAKSTVSRYLNGGSVSLQTKKKIEQIIQEQNYIPNTFAQSLKAKKTNMIGAIVPRLDSYATSQTLMGMDEELRSQQYHLLISNTNQEQEREIEAIYDFARQKVSGVILLAAEVTDAHLKAIKEVCIPVILVGQKHTELHSIIHDDFKAGYLIGQHVLAKGHQHIAYLGVTEKDVAVGVKRKGGFQKAVAHKDAHITYYETGFKMKDAMKTASHLLTSSSPSIIVCATDNIALGVMKAAYAQGINMPTQLSITGFGGYDTSEIVHPTLTTVGYSYFKAGTLSAAQVIKLVEETDVNRCITLDVKLIERESVDNR
ncbi:LacI family DNA-binding transcriptional regulator [Priestia endophytica]|uniref:LacI family DNA-binding transcriptional regulator n=1 Tax=Priestia endophytica TaxID=135735 RepID=UPI000DCA6819|nr:LacI family DNA-binding transcriptional regulator [Priestia endophytica]RAS83579.1 LacI family transcriptional regulator [Priestia endophytica]